MSKYEDAKEELKNSLGHDMYAEYYEGVAERIRTVGSGAGEDGNGNVSVAIKINEHLFSASPEQLAEILIQLADVTTAVHKATK